jgi:hypothetical protein
MSVRLASNTAASPLRTLHGIVACLERRRPSLLLSGPVARRGPGARPSGEFPQTDAT